MYFNINLLIGVKTMDMKQTIQGMLKENTGTHMLDSGGDNNRRWQKNQSINFDGTDSIYFDDCSIYRSTYHYLIDNLSITKESKIYQEKYNQFIKDSEECYLVDMENFVDYLQNQDILQDDDYIVGNTPKSNNTYNYDNLIDQVLQYIIFYSNNEYYILLQIHGGCDVRGGYTAPKIFKIEDIENFISQQYNCEVTTKKANYSSDDTYHFYKDGSTEHGTFEYEHIYSEGITEVF